MEGIEIYTVVNLTEISYDLRVWVSCSYGFWSASCHFILVRKRSKNLKVIVQQKYNFFVLFKAKKYKQVNQPD